MMGDYVEQILNTITRVEAQFIPRESWATSNNVAERNYQGLVLLSQLEETKRVLHGLNPSLEGHKPVHRELYRAVMHIETSAKQWWSPGMHNGEPVLAKWREYFLEILLAVRWWTMVAALQQGQKFTGSEIYCNMLFMEGKGLKGVSQVNPQSSRNLSCERHFPSIGFEIWLQKPESSRLNDILQWKIESGSILGENEYRANVALEDIRNASLAGFTIEGMLASYIDEATSPLIEEEVTVDLTRDVLGVSRIGSWVIRTKYQGVDCALKRVDNGDSEQPIIARLSHPHIVQLMHYWRKDEALFLMMELMEGDLTDLLARHKRSNESLLSLPMAVDIILQTARGMLYLHDLNITYPHLNCSNILFRRSSTLQDGYIEYIIKLSGGGYSVERFFSHSRKTYDVYRFGLFCLEVFTGRQPCEESLGVVADARPSIPEAISPILRFCIASCFEGSLHFGFEHVVALLLLAQYEILNSQKDDAFLSFGSKDLESMQLDQHSSESPSTSDSDLEKYPVHQLYPGSDVAGSDSNLSATLIFFHGFAKSPDEWKSAWMTRNRELVWPKAWLPKDLPGNVRILSLSYDKDSPGQSQDVSAIEIGENVLRQLVLGSKWNLAEPEGKIILVGHSFGGLVIKSLVVEAHNLAYVSVSGKAKMDEALVMKCRIFLDNLKGIVFYSVPGSAGQDQQFEQYIVKLNQTGVLQRSSLMQALLKDKRLFDQQMQRLCSQFEENVPQKTQILGFIEGKGMRRIREKQVVVSDASARAQLKKADFTILEEDNHFEVCRPVSTDHKGYKILVEHFLKGKLKIGIHEGVTHIPLGLRFHPTDVELVEYYLMEKINGRPIERNPIAEVDVFKCEPWDLPGMSPLQSSDEWYFYSALDKKHLTGTNRATEIGYWKSTGKDRTVRSHHASGIKKTLVFYSGGRAPEGEKTEWIMHEYRMQDKVYENLTGLQKPYILAHVFKKSGSGRKSSYFLPEEIEDTLAVFPGPVYTEADFPDGLDDRHFRDDIPMIKFDSSKFASTQILASKKSDQVSIGVDGIKQLLGSDWGGEQRTEDDETFLTPHSPKSSQSPPQPQMPTCQVDKCFADLSRGVAKDYHRRHKVCVMHSRSPTVLVSGVMQRFCQQCSRFHALQEFDGGERICRRRLAGHIRWSKTYPQNRAASSPWVDALRMLSRDLLLARTTERSIPPIFREPSSMDPPELLLREVAISIQSEGAGSASRATNAERDSLDESLGIAEAAVGAADSADPSSPSSSDDKGIAGSKQSTEDGGDDEPDSKRRKKDTKAKDLAPFF